MRNLVKIKKYIINENFLGKGLHCTVHEAAEMSNPENFIFIIKKFQVSSNNLFYLYINHVEEYFYKKNTIEVITNLIDIIHTPEYIYHVYEKEPHKTLEENLKSPSFTSSTNFKNLIEILFLIIKALLSLHEKGNAIHLNLNPSHIFINNMQNEVKFCGNSFLYYLPSKIFLNKITKNSYIAPEIATYDSENHPYSNKTDIYSIGILAYALFANKKFNFNVIITKKDIEEMHLNSSEIKEFILDCIHQDPKLRPSANKLLNYNIFNFTTATTMLSHISISSNSSLNIEKPSINLKIRTVNTIHPYEIGQCIGKGKFGTVYIAKIKHSNQIFAIKRIEMYRIQNDKEKELIEGEIKLLLEMKGFDFFVQIKDYFYFEDSLYLILEYCNGGNIKDHIYFLKQKFQYLKLDEVKLIARNVAEGIYYLHKNKIVHRDIKPENIFLIKDSKQRIIDSKIGDFGLSRKLLEGEKEFFTIAGTLQYMAPEIIDNANHINTHLTPQIDVYSFGVFLLFIAFGVEPLLYENNKNQRFLKPILNIPRYIEDFPVFNDLIKKCLEIDPIKRINSEEIMNHPFFTNISIGKFPFSLENNGLVKIYEGKLVNCYLDTNKKLWIKEFKENLLDKRNLKYINRGIDFLHDIKGIPHILELVNFGIYQQNKSIIEVFPFCNGYSLNKLYASRKNPNPMRSFSKEEIKKVAKSLFEFLVILHKKNYVHRSLNPSHILIILNSKMEIDEIKIIGFSTFKYDDNSENSIIMIDEELFYNDPSILEKEFIYTYESDIYSVGMIIYFMAFGNSFIKNKEEFSKKRNNFSMDNLYLLDKEISNIIKFCIKSKKPNEFSKFETSDFLKIM